MPILTISDLASAISSASGCFHSSSVSLQKYSSPIQTVSGSATMKGSSC